jgi:hypothetical protein
MVSHKKRVFKWYQSAKKGKSFLLQDGIGGYLRGLKTTLRVH